MPRFYDRQKAVTYAHTWAFRRNGKYYNFDPVGGDCTNFISQCLYAGCGVMNLTRDYGWYYVSLSNRAAAWAGVEYLYRFLTNNKGPGPYASEKPLSAAIPGDIIQLSFDGEAFRHSLMVVSVGEEPAPENILLTAHTNDADNKPLALYTYMRARLLHIEGVR